ncbi:phage recombination protein Bet [Pseudoglutamicibacter cumminsii]|uniref:phage recombination protein Bet n=1 Tax=Pseudoglutamicibacter cumminsii TaxID=156979 RepID=UPI0021A4381D|nr:phage recombination protein Bet [Pseudoglutamicibacter cumminsii]MCT1685487.1 phage recombination protein Bet [Pseudoglutamicibacter cumminsii]
MSEITHKQASSDLAITDDQTTFTPAQVAALQHIGVATNNPADVAVLFHQAKKTGLDPFRRQIYMITRKMRDGSRKPTIQTGIDGFYEIARRAAAADGTTFGIPETYWCGDDGVWRDVWLPSQPPAAAKVVVTRGAASFTTVAITREYMANSPLWQKMPARMIAKCAEALAIRKAFPDVTSGLYTSEEMAQAGPGDQPAPQPQQAPQAQGPADTVDELVALLPDATTLDEVTDIARRLTQINAPGEALDQARARWTAIHDQNTTDADEAEVVEDAEEVDAA